MDREPREGAFEQVDTIRFIKTNKLYYNRAILLFLKYYTVNRLRMQDAFARESDRERVVAELQQFLQDGKASSNQSNSTMTGSSLCQQQPLSLAPRVAKHISSVLIACYKETLLPAAAESELAMELFLA